MLFKFSSEYAISSVHSDNPGGLKFNDTHQFPVHPVDVNILGGSIHIHTIKKNTEALLVASKEIVLEVNAEKTKYTVMCRDENARKNHNIKIDNKSLERVEQFKHLRRTLTN